MLAINSVKLRTERETNRWEVSRGVVPGMVPVAWVRSPHSFHLQLPEDAIEDSFSCFLKIYSLPFSC